MIKRLCLACFIFALSAISVSAQQPPVTATLSTEYQFVSSGDSTVITNIELTNQTTGVYAPEFTLHVNGMVAAEVSAFDATGPIPVEAIPSDQSTDIKIKFIRPVGGKGRSQNATIKYTGPKATLREKIWEIAIPSFSPQSFITSSGVTITTPPDFGIPVETHPAPQKAETLKGGQRRIHFLNTNKASSNITLRYGNFASYRFELRYTLANTSTKDDTFSVQIPADSFDHQLNYSSLTPAPLNVVADADGSWNALYEVQKGKTLSVVASGISSSQEQPDEFFKKYTPEVKITPTQYEFDSSAPPNISWLRVWQYMPIVKNEFLIEISNPNGVALYNIPVLASASGFEIDGQDQRLIDTLPPFGKTKVPLRFKSRLIPPEEPRLVALGVGSTSISYNITDKYVIVWYVSIITFITCFLLGMGFVTVKARHLHLQKHPRNHSVHRQSKKSS